AMSAREYFSRLCALLVDNPARAADAPMMRRMARLGIAPGRSFDLDAFPSEVRRAIEDALPIAQEAIRREGEHLGEVVNGWQVARDLGRYGTKYLYRAAWTYFGVGGNLIEDACYPTTTVDRDGRPLSGTNRYVLCFKKDQIPPVNAFWS